jgi:RimJ/RimL family protein N-acetyltransferase
MRGLAVIREAGLQDRNEIEARLIRRIDGAMFPLANLRDHGLGEGGFASDHAKASRYWLVGESGVVAVSRAGIVMPVLDRGLDRSLDRGLDRGTDLSRLAPALAGLTVTGVVGAAEAARPVVAALGLAGHPMRLDADEPGFALDLGALAYPVPAGLSLQRLASVHRALALAWRGAAKVETEGMDVEEAQASAIGNVADWIAADSHRILLDHGRPVALTGFNARISEIVQIGGVYTPPGLRNRGYARAAVALHLAEARAEAVARAVLFAASPAAARAYAAIGFQPTADFTLALLEQPVTLPS